MKHSKGDAMSEYHKIVTVYERDPETKFKKLIDGKWACPEFEYLANNEWEWTEKVDGTNVRIIWDSMGTVKLGGKTDNAQLHVGLVEWMHTKFYSGALSRALNGPAVLYGEGYGPKIQSGGIYRQDMAVILFDVWCGGVWLKREDVQDIANKLEVEAVPVVGRGSLHDAVGLVRGGLKSQWGDFIAEGLVMRPSVELLDRRGNRVITKVKAKDF